MTVSTLTEPGKIGGLLLKNRMLLAAMGSNFAEEDGTCGERLLDYYEERARGGAALLVLETSTIAWPAGSTMPRMVGFSDERFLPGLQSLAARVHRHDCRIAAQLNHGGKVAQEDVVAGRPVLVPSIPDKKPSDMFSLLSGEEIANFIKAAGPDGKGARYHVMTQDDINTLVNAFANAADLAKRANFDAVEIHAGHGYVLSSFLSPAVNKREDAYGCSRENRARLLCDVIRAVRSVVGKDFPILVRMDSMEYRIEGGITLDDALVTAKLVEEAGADAIDVSAYGNTSKGIAFTEAPLVHQPGGFIPFARAIKATVNIPVIGVGRIELETAEQSLADGDFDFLAMGRKLLADPHLPNKVASGERDHIRPCIYCYLCVSQIFINQPMRCAVNPACGQERDMNVIASDSRDKHVLVVGGGPAGLEAAAVAARRGMRVTLWEREADLGGTARIAALPYEPNQRIVRYLSRQVSNLDIEVSTGKTATLENIRQLAPDHVIVATGANREAPEVRGKHQRHVFDGAELRGLLFGTDPAAARKLPLYQRAIVTIGRWSQLLRSISALRFLSRVWMPLSRRVVLVGGGLVGVELAEYLEARGREVTVIEPGPHLGAELSIVRRARVLHELREHGVALYTGAKDIEIGEKCVRFVADDEAHEIEAGSVIISMGAKPDTAFADELAAEGISVVSIGDCHEVGYIEGAIHSGRKAALGIV